ncbi:GNAT family N-acetyltransferase [Clostridia bacterium OttesenSCG-928-F22]|nr:GNAT family N-acetyltransferase [Clostridia bacterium OttesenSCG-928-F22]
MLTIKEMQQEDYSAIMELVQRFYSSDAVDHAVEEEILQRMLGDAIAKDKGLYGYALWEGDMLVGFGYVTSYYCTEVAGTCIMLEDLFIAEDCQGKGYGTLYIEEMKKRYPEARRFRLEVTPHNTGAKKLYQRLGFEMLPYEQMIWNV